VKSWADREGVTQRGLSVVAEQIAAAKPRPRSETLRDAGRPNLENPNKTHGRRHKYPRHPLARDPVPEVPSDSVADLYADIVP